MISKFNTLIFILLAFFLCVCPSPTKAERACDALSVELRCFLPYYLRTIKPAFDAPKDYQPARSEYIQFGKHDLYTLAVLKAYRALGNYDEAMKLYPEILQNPGSRTLEYLIHQERYDDVHKALKDEADLDKCSAAIQTFSFYEKIDHIQKLFEKSQCLKYVAKSVDAVCYDLPPIKLSPVIHIAVELIPDSGLQENEKQENIGQLHKCYRTLVWLNQSKDVLAEVDFPLSYKIQDFLEWPRRPPNSTSEYKRAPVRPICKMPVSTDDIEDYKNNSRLMIGDKQLKHIAECTVANGNYSEFIQYRPFKNDYSASVGIVHAFRDAMMKGHYDVNFLTVMDHLVQNTGFENKDFKNYNRDQFENAVLVSVAIGLSESLQHKYWPDKIPAQEAKELAEKLEKYREYFQSAHHLRRWDEIIFWLYWNNDLRKTGRDFTKRYPSVEADPAISRMLAEDDFISPEQVAAKIKTGYDLRETVNPLLDCHYRPDTCKEKLPVALKIINHIQDPATRFFALTRLLVVITDIHQPFHAKYYRPFNSNYMGPNDFEW